MLTCNNRQTLDFLSSRTYPNDARSGRAYASDHENSTECRLFNCETNISERKRVRFDTDVNRCARLAYIPAPTSNVPQFNTTEAFTENALPKPCLKAPSLARDDCFTMDGQRYRNRFPVEENCTGRSEAADNRAFNSYRDHQTKERLTEMTRQNNQRDSNPPSMTTTTTTENAQHIGSSNTGAIMPHIPTRCQQDLCCDDRLCDEESGNFIPARDRVHREPDICTPFRQTAPKRPDKYKLVLVAKDQYLDAQIAADTLRKYYEKYNPDGIYTPQCDMTITWGYSKLKDHFLMSNVAKTARPAHKLHNKIIRELPAPQPFWIPRSVEDNPVLHKLKDEEQPYRSTVVSRSEEWSTLRQMMPSRGNMHPVAQVPLERGPTSPPKSLPYPQKRFPKIASPMSKYADYLRHCYPTFAT